MKFIVLLLVLIIVWFVPIVRHEHRGNCNVQVCSGVVYIETIKQYVSEEIQILNYKMNFN